MYNFKRAKAADAEAGVLQQAGVLTVYDVAVFRQIVWKHTDKGTGRAQVSYTALMDKLNLCRDAVWKSLKRLVKLGLLLKHKDWHRIFEGGFWVTLQKTNEYEIPAILPESVRQTVIRYLESSLTIIRRRKEILQNIRLRRLAERNRYQPHSRARGQTQDTASVLEAALANLGRLIQEKAAQGGGNTG